MSKIPFTVYDFFAYLSSGSVILATVDLFYGEQWLLRHEIGLVLGVFLVFLAYVTGHVVAHFSSLVLEHLLVDKVLRRPARALLGEKAPALPGILFPGYYRALPQETRKRIAARATERSLSGSGEGLFLHAYSVVTRDDRAQQRLDEFRNLYGFARNMAMAFFVAAVLLAVAVPLKRVPTYWWAAVAVFFGLTMLYRYLKFFRQFSYQLLITYAELPTKELE